MSAPVRRGVLSLHVIFAVGWLGAVLAFVALAVVGLTSSSTQVVASSYVAMNVVTRGVILPLGIAPLITGPLLSLGTRWGLFRHYWVVAKIVITLVSTAILVVHLGPIDLLGTEASKGQLAPELAGLRVQMLAASLAAVGALTVATTLAVYKPRGLTPHGWRKQEEELADSRGVSRS